MKHAIRILFPSFIVAGIAEVLFWLFAASSSALTCFLRGSGNKS
jgi:hypothetical protein